MTPQFTTPCYVRVDDPKKLKEVCDELERIGYGCTVIPKYATHIVAGSKNFIATESPNKECWIFDDRIDCGTNIDLFLALAGMRKDTDIGQWFITEQNEWFVSKYDSQHLYPCERTIDDVKIGIRNVRKATAAEIIEHFNRQTK